MNFINHLLTRKFGSRKTAGDDGGASPFLVEFFMVQGIGFRCMAYRDAEGRWRTAFEHEELTGSIQVLG
jgi:hypothetical protein